MLTRENTKQLKGFAVLLMLAHHLFAFSDRIPYGFDFSRNIFLSNTLTSFIGVFGKICVPIFMFLGGYGLYASCVYKEDNENKIKNKFIIKIVNLYKCYWKVFIIFVPLGILFFLKQPQFSNENFGSSFSNVRTYNVISTFLGIETYFNYEWWFFKSYLFALFEGFMFLELFKNNKSIYKEVFVIILWYIIISSLLPNIISLCGLNSLTNNFWYLNLFCITSCSILFFIGICFSKYDIFSRFYKIIKDLSHIESIVISFITFVLCFYVKAIINNNDLDILIVPIVCFSVIVMINHFSLLAKGLLLLGNNSTNMWLTHSFYCYYFYPFVKIVYGSRNALIAFITLVVLSLITSFLIDLSWKYVSKLYNQIHIFLLNKGY